MCTTFAPGQKVPMSLTVFADLNGLLSPTILFVPTRPLAPSSLCIMARLTKVPSMLLALRQEPDASTGYARATFAPLQSARAPAVGSEGNLYRRTFPLPDTISRDEN